MRAALPIACFTLALSCFAAPVWAQSAADAKKAQEHFAKGAEKYAAGEYAAAVAEFMSGHAVAPNAMFLYNVSLCYERLGRYDDALSAAARARNFEGMPPEVAVRNEARIASFGVIVRSQDAAPAIARAAAENAEEEPEEVVVTPRTETRPDGITALGWVGAGLVAVGGGLLVGGVVTNSAIVGEIDTYRDAAARGDQTTYNESRDTIEKKQGLGKVLYGVGAGVAGLGAALFIVDLLTGTEEVPVAALVPTRDGVLVGAFLRF